MTHMRFGDSWSTMRRTIFLGVSHAAWYGGVWGKLPGPARGRIVKTWKILKNLKMVKIRKMVDPKFAKNYEIVENPKIVVKMQQLRKIRKSKFRQKKCHFLAFQKIVLPESPASDRAGFF